MFVIVFLIVFVVVCLWLCASGCVFVVVCLWLCVCDCVLLVVFVVVCLWLCVCCPACNCVLRSGGEHWARMVVVEVWQGTLGADGCG